MSSSNAERSNSQRIARLVAKEQGVLVNRINSIAKNAPHMLNGLGAYHEGDVLGLIATVSVAGFEEVQAHFRHHTENGLFLPKTNVNTSSILSFNLYTDRATAKSALWAYLLRSNPSPGEPRPDVTVGNDMFQADDFFTYYLADEEGNHAKVITIPSRIARATDLQIEGHRINNTISTLVPMTRRDLALMSQLTQKLQGALGI